MLADEFLGYRDHLLVTHVAPSPPHPLKPDKVKEPPTSQSATDYDKLCQIFKDVVQEPIDLRMKEVKILERVQKELPDFFNANFVHITKAKPDMRYQFIKQLAEQETKKPWDCETIKSYYANEFK